MRHHGIARSEGSQVTALYSRSVALTRSRAVPNIAIQRVPMLHAALYGVVPLAADRGGERAEHPNPVQRDRLARRLKVPPASPLQHPPQNRLASV